MWAPWSVQLFLLLKGFAVHLHRGPVQVWSGGPEPPKFASIGRFRWFHPRWADCVQRQLRGDMPVPHIKERRLQILPITLISSIGAGRRSSADATRRQILVCRLPGPCPQRLQDDVLAEWKTAGSDPPSDYL